MQSSKHMYEFIPLSSSSFPLFSSFFPPEILERITKDQDSTSLPIAFGVTWHYHPIGAAAAILTTSLHYVEILHIEIHPHHRNKHLGRNLVKHIQEKASLQGAKIFSLIYFLNTPETPMIEKMLKANQWKGSRPFMVQCTFDSLTFNPPWLYFPYRYPKDFEEFLWKDLKASERENVSQREHCGEFPSFVSPFRQEENLEYLNSLGLRNKERVVGWLIAHRTHAETVHFSSLYMEPSLHFHGFAIKLLVDSILLHKKAPTPWASLEIPLLQIHPSWFRFIKKRTFPHAFKIAWLQQAWHTIL